MSVPVKLEDLLMAHDWVSSDGAAMVDAAAYINRETGTIHWCGDGVDEDDVPGDIEDGGLYIAVPAKRNLDLGRSLPLRFVEERLPDAVDKVYGFFRRPGAYSRFKSLLADVGQLEAWYDYENAAVENALREWCEANGFVLVR